MAAIDYQNITPLSVAGLEEKELRRLYSGLRSILRKRIERAAEKGEPTMPVPAATKNVAAADLKMEIADIAAKLRDPSTRTKRKKGKEVSPVTKAFNKLQKQFPELKRYQMKEFGRFMDMIRERMGSRYEVAVIDRFTELKKSGVRMSLIAEKYKSYLESETKLDKLVDAVNKTKAETGSVRMSDIEKALKGK